MSALWSRLRTLRESALGVELLALARIAAPVIATNAVNYGAGLTDVAFIG